MGTCEICAIEVTLSKLYEGWGGYVCADNPECRSPYCYTPKRREVATLTTAILDELEWQADEQYRTMMPPDVAHDVLRALIDIARRDLQREAEDKRLRDLATAAIDLAYADRQQALAKWLSDPTPVGEKASE